MAMFRISSAGRQALSRHTTFFPALCSTRRDSSTIFVGGLSWGLDEGIVREAFSSFGEVREVRIVTDRETKKSKGYGFVTFVAEKDAKTALQAMDGKELNGREIRVNFAARDIPSRMSPGFSGGVGR